MSRPQGGGPVPEAPPPAGVEVRPARPADGKDALALVARVAAEGRWIRTEDVSSERGRRTRRRFRRSWTTEHADIVALAGGRVIGHLGVERERGRQTRHVASLGMAVDEFWRGKGVGSALLAEAFRWSAWAGVEKVALTVYPDNQRAINLYKKFGFTEEGRLSGHSKRASGYEDEIVMARWL
ncbi:MAG: GNAT family N-acetyltransferase [Actinomycetota bacterium]